MRAALMEPPGHGDTLPLSPLGGGLLIDAAIVRAALFDLDGVITSTARVHRTAWRQTFDPLLAHHGLPPFTDADYRHHVDGRRREDGIATFLAARGIAADGGLVRDVAERKNAAYLNALTRGGVTVMPGAKTLLKTLRAAGVRLALFTASRNAHAVLRAAALDDAFDGVFDGTFAADRGLRGKPNADVPAAALAALGAAPEQAILFEDAGVGIAAGRAAGIPDLVGVAVGDGAEELLDAGASAIVASLEAVRVAP